MDKSDIQRRFNVWWVALSVLSILAIFIWATDRVTFQGERTIYTVTCVNGTWVGTSCTGNMTTGSRFRYRALRTHREVLFWELGSPDPSSKLTDCTIQDGRNWTCPVSRDANRSITLEMAKGVAVTNDSWPTRPFHAVGKVTWLLIDAGFPAGLIGL